MRAYGRRVMCKKPCTMQSWQWSCASTLTARLHAGSPRVEVLPVRRPPVLAVGSSPGTSWPLERSAARVDRVRHRLGGPVSGRRAASRGTCPSRASSAACGQRGPGTLAGDRQPLRVDVQRGRRGFVGQPSHGFGRVAQRRGVGFFGGEGRAGIARRRWRRLPPRLVPRTARHKCAGRQPPNRRRAGTAAPVVGRPVAGRSVFGTGPVMGRSCTESRGLRGMCTTPASA